MQTPIGAPDVQCVYPDRACKRQEQLGDIALQAAQSPEANLPDDERKEIVEFAQRRRDRRQAPKARVASKPGKPLAIDFNSPIGLARFMSAFGTAEVDCADLMLCGMVNAACNGNTKNLPSERDINQALAAVNGIGARDEIEGMLPTQMVATHFAAINALRRLKGSENIPQQDSNGGLAVKLLRTFTMQLEALQRYRGKGQQKVTVEHVNVHAGGQAIVGAVGSGGRERQSDEGSNGARKITYEPGSPMRRPDPCREAVPIAGSAGKASWLFGRFDGSGARLDDVILGNTIQMLTTAPDLCNLQDIRQKTQEAQWLRPRRIVQRKNVLAQIGLLRQVKRPVTH